MTKDVINPFNFEIKTHVIFGEKKLLELAEILKSEGFKSVAVIIDSALKNNDLIKESLEKIKQNNISAEIFLNEVKEEPTYDYLDEFKLKLKEDYDCIIGIGGGSNLDLSKAMATLLRNSGKALSYRGFPKLENKPIPVIAVPTTAGSGSEVTFNAVFTEKSENRKLGINSKYNYPIHAILDPMLTLSCPEKTTISSGADALVHCVETFVVKTTSIYAKMFCKQAFKLLYNNMIKILDNLNDIDVRGKILLGAHFAGAATMNAGSAGISGAMTYPLGGIYKIPHGIAGGIFLPKIIRFNVEKGFEGYAELYDLIDSADKNLSIRTKNLAFADKMDFLAKKIKLPALTELGLSEQDIGFLNSYLFENLKGAVENNPVSINKQDMEAILKSML